MRICTTLLALGLLGLLTTAHAPLAHASVPNDQQNFCLGPQQPMGAVTLPSADGKLGALGSELWFDFAELRTAAGKHISLLSYFFQFDLSFLGLPPFTLEIVAIADLDSGKHQHQIVTSFGATYPTTANRYALGNSEGWTMFGERGVGGFAGSVSASPSDPGSHDYDFALRTRTLKDPIPQFHGGAIDYGTTSDGVPRGTQTLFSRTRLAVEGTISIDGRTERAVGTGWHDRQTGIYNQVSGHWFGIQLDDGPLGGELLGTDITAFTFYDAVTGAPIDGAATVVGRAPTCRYDALDKTSFTMSYDYTNAFVSGATGKRYPRRGTLTIPSLSTTLTITPITLGEIDYGGGIMQSPSKVTGTFRGRAVTGFAYFEIPGID